MDFFGICKPAIFAAVKLNDLKMRRFLSISMFLIAAVSGFAQDIEMSLDSCLALAIRNNKEVSISQMKEEAATYTRKAAFTKYLPQIEAQGGYYRNEKELQLLSEEQQQKFSNLGTAFAQSAQNSLGQMMQDPQMQQMLGQMGFTPQMMQGMMQNFGSSLGEMGSAINGIGAGLVEALRTDTRNVTAAAISLTQPLYMGGKIVAYNNITKYAEQIAHSQKEQKIQELVVNVETIYWQIVSLESKRQLAQSYKQLIDTLSYNVDQLIAEGFASKADGLSVRVKQNEADVTLIQIDNGLALSRMLLAQYCGLDAATIIRPTDQIDKMSDFSLYDREEATSQALQNRPELISLELLSKINGEKVKVARSEHLPTVALNANYIWTNPSVFNGFENKLKGMWNVGVLVKVPISGWGEGYYKTRAAKAEARIAQATYDETCEKIELQTTQCVQKANEAMQRQETARRSLAVAEENLRYANEGMKEGVIPISNVIAAQTAWLSAHSTLVSSQIDVRLAEINLRRAMGIVQ